MRLNRIVRYSIIQMLMKKTVRCESKSFTVVVGQIVFLKMSMYPQLQMSVIVSEWLKCIYRLSPENYQKYQIYVILHLIFIIRSRDLYALALMSSEICAIICSETKKKKKQHLLYLVLCILYISRVQMRQIPFIVIIHIKFSKVIVILEHNIIISK